MDSTRCHSGNAVTVAILSDSPTLTTGFARTTAHIAASLARRHVVHCYGIKARPGDVRDGLGYHVWPAEQGGHWSDYLGQFFSQTRPEVLLLNMDAKNALECLELCRGAGLTTPIVSYVCFDGLPVGRRYLDAQRTCAAVWATSEPGAAYLRSEGIHVTGVAPPGVDPAEFRPSPGKMAVRREIGLRGHLLVGVFATNTERKQIPRAIAGFTLAAAALSGMDLHLYLHCRPSGYWDLPELVQRHGIAERVTMPDLDDYSEARGIPLTIRGAHRASIHSLGFADRLALCDIVVNTPHSGDVEQVILEANACGAALVHTDDEGIMRHAAGQGAVLLSAADVGTGSLGEAHHHVSAAEVARQLIRLAKDARARADLVARGIENAVRFPWSTLENAALAMVGPFTKRESAR
jgi:glycosyltransferase involved in cell wall biosynthesis